jgi:FkbM family methyltransferase
VFIEQEYDFLVETQPKVIIDAGANIGLASIYFASKYPDAKIIAIEPEQSNFELLKENVAPYPHVVPIQAALWNKNEEINLIDPGSGKWGFMTEMKQPSKKIPSKTCHTVMGTTIDKIMQDYSLTKIDILKIDIEGAEKEVFSDTSSWIGKVDAVIIELHERFKPGCNRSFYRGSNGFDSEWSQGENMYLSRGNCLARRSA